MGPPLSAVNCWPSSSNVTVITEPAGRWCTSTPASLKRVVATMRELGKMPV